MNDSRRSKLKLKEYTHIIALAHTLIARNQSDDDDDDDLVCFHFKDEITVNEMTFGMTGTAHRYTTYTGVCVCA